MKKFIIFLVAALMFSVNVSAQTDYEKHYENTGVDSLQQGIGDETKSFLNESGIELKNPDWVSKLTDEGVFSHIWKFITGGTKTPIKVGVLIASVILLAAAFSAFGTETRFETAIYASTLAIAVLIAGSVWQSVSAAVNTIKACSIFMMSFVPVFATTAALSGKTVTAPAMSALLLGAAESVSMIASFVVLPLVGGYLALSISCGVSPLIKASGIADGLKKISIWIISLISTLFVGILSIQSVVNSAADSVTMRAAKFILGTSVPIAGGVLGEAVSTISASMGLLRTSVGIYGVVVLLFTILPIVIELFMWRMVMMLNISLGELFALPKMTGVLRAVESMLSFLTAIILIVGGMFIISLVVVVSVSRG